MSKVSGPMLDRIDLHIDVPALPLHTLTHTQTDGEPSSAIKQRVVKARALQRKRLKSSGLFVNAQMRHKDVRRLCVLTTGAADFLKQAIEELSLSARSYDKILKLSRTIADLAASDEILQEHLAEAIQYRSLDRPWWG